MPPKRKHAVAPKEESTTKIVEEVPSRPKRNRAVKTYNEDYTDEPKEKQTKAKPPKNAGAAKDKKITKSKSKDDDNDVEVKATNGRKKKVEKPEEVDEDVEESEVVKVKAAKGRKKVVKKPEVVDEVDEDDEDAEDVEDLEDVEDDVVEVKAVKGKKKIDDEAEGSDAEVKATKGRKKKIEKQDKEDDDDVVDDVADDVADEIADEVAEKPKKKGKKSAAAPKNKTATAYDEINFNDCTRKNENGKEWNFKISSWNVDGIRAWINKGGLDYIQHEKPDVFCLQETKCSEDKLPADAKEIDGYKAYWVCSDKDGYAGVGLYSKIEPISVQYGLDAKEHDNEGRIITAEFDKFYVISVYVPNSGRGLVTLPKRLKWNESFRKYVADLDEKKPVIVCGDMNVSHLEIDLSNPKTNTKNAGFTKEEREGMTEFLGDGYVDSFRKIYPDKTQAYTFWTYMSNCRAKNIGWRLDYFIVSERFMDNICDNIIRSQVFGSDHCPLTLFLNV